MVIVLEYFIITMPPAVAATITIQENKWIGLELDIYHIARGAHFISVDAGIIFSGDVSVEISKKIMIDRSVAAIFTNYSSIKGRVFG